MASSKIMSDVAASRSDSDSDSNSNSDSVIESELLEDKMSEKRKRFDDKDEDEDEDEHEHEHVHEEGKYPDVDDHGNRTSMSAEEYHRYEEQVYNSKGYDVEKIPGVSTIGQIMPTNLENPRNVYWVNLGAELAIKDYCQRNSGTNYTLDKIIKANGQCIRGFTHYITFEATDAATGRTDTFQAKIQYGFAGEDDVVEECRIRPTTLQS